MADPTLNPKPTDDKQPALPTAPVVRPLSVDTEKELRATIRRLQSDLADAQAEVKAQNELLAEQEKSRADAKVKKSSGPKVPVAIVPILGEGRRMVQPGGALKQSEIVGLTEGEHFANVDA